MENGTAKVTFRQRLWWLNPAALERVDKAALFEQRFKETFGKTSKCDDENDVYVKLCSCSKYVNVLVMF